MNWINPYSSTKQEEAKETPIKLGVSDYNKNWKHFWFEEDLRRWIRGK